MERSTARTTRVPPGAAFDDSTPLPRNLCPRTLLASVTPATRCPRGARPWAVPGAHSPRAGATVPGAGNPVVPGHPARLWPSSPQLAGHVNIRRTPLRSLALCGGAYRRKCPADLPLQAPTAPGAATGNTLPLSRAPGLSGASAPATYPPYEYRLPAGFTKREGIGIGDSGRTPGSCAEGLDHWSNESGAASAVRDGAVPGRVPRIGRRMGRF